MMRVGIPDFHLPADVLDDEIFRLKKMGLQIITEARVGVDIPFAQLLKKFDAVFAGTGATLSRPPGVSDESAQPSMVDSSGMVSGVELLHRINLGMPDDLGRKVIVIGGGNTAVDVARSLWRLGKDVSIMFSGIRREMSAVAETIDELIEEGVPIEFLVSPVEVLLDPADGPVVGLKCLRLQPGDSGGSESIVACDSVVTAIGEISDLSYLPQDYLAETSGKIIADEFGRTSDPKFFAGGDAVDSAGTVAAAIGSGRKAAIAIDAMLRGSSTYSSGHLPHPHVVSFEEINLANTKLTERLNLDNLPVSERAGSFAEVHNGFDEIACIHEAIRCFSCETSYATKTAVFSPHETSN
jgi:NADPH-dependent glutamate synthase beta subunit-like oxidoreductase